jgi:endonuclease/exonuclease/phosphatase family metal-dependent hydrolase
MRIATRAGCLGLALLPVALAGFVYVMSFFNARTGSPQDFASSALLAHPPAPLAKPITLKVVTFNIQDTWVVGRNRPARMRALGSTLVQLDPDVVGFQEAFVESERAILLDALKDSRLQHFHYFPSGTMGSGLLVACAFPIRESWFHRYESAGDWYKVWEGDWWAGKGAGLARVELPEGLGYLDFYNTHAQAGYGNAQYKVVREDQMTALGRFINESRLRTVPALLVGDLNCRRDQPDHEAIVTTANLTRLMNVDTTLDHIYGVKNPAYAFELLETIELTDGPGPDGIPIRLSDHHGYLSTIRITPAAGPKLSSS